MTIVERTNNFDDDRPPLEFGVEWDRTNSHPINCLTRIGDAATMTVDTTMLDPVYSTYDSSFDDYLPWSGMRRLQMNIQGDVFSDVETDAPDESSSAPVCVRLPYFFYKLEFNTPTTDHWRYWISPYPLKGYRLHPAFLHLNADGTKTTFSDIYVGAYEANVTASGKNDPIKCSLADIMPDASKTRNTFRIAIEGMGPGTNQSGFHILDWRTWNALQWLYLVEYASLDSQSPSGSTAQGGLSEGIARTGVATAGLQLTGWTSSYDFTVGSYDSHNLGNKSGQVRCDTDASANPVWAMSYHGIENLWGNTWTALDGCNCNTAYEIWIVKEATQFSDYVQNVSSPYNFNPLYCENTGMKFPTDTGYTQLTLPGNSAQTAESSWMFGDWNTVAWSAPVTTYTCDAYVGTAAWTTEKYPIVGGSAAGLAYVGIWEFQPWSYASTYGTIGTRIMQVPRDMTYWKIKL